MSDEPHVSPQTDVSEDLLPYVIELWTEDGRDVAFILARVRSASLANAVFSASRADFLDRRITLRRGARIIVDSQPLDRLVQST